jgi:hypothetical protein
VTEVDRGEIAQAMKIHFGFIWLTLVKKGVVDRDVLTGLMQSAADEERFGQIERHVARILAHDPSPAPFTVVNGGKADE